MKLYAVWLKHIDGGMKMIQCLAPNLYWAAETVKMTDEYGEEWKINRIEIMKN